MRIHLSFSFQHTYHPPSQRKDQKYFSMFDIFSYQICYLKRFNLLGNNAQETPQPPWMRETAMKKILFHPQTHSFFAHLQKFIFLSNTSEAFIYLPSRALDLALISFFLSLVFAPEIFNKFVSSGESSSFFSDARSLSLSLSLCHSNPPHNNH